MSGQRFLSLDVLRGLTVALMIVVNTPGSWSHVYAPLLHADWHGFTPTDWVFPTFLFVVGNALAFALPKYAALGDGAVVAKVLRRAGLIFLLGFLLYWFPFVGPEGSSGFRLLPLADTRIPGVLQRIGLCFGIAALVLHFFKGRGAAVFAVLALAGHWFILAKCGDYTLQGNAAAKVDLWLLGERHLYHGEGLPFDPEGLLGTLPATVNVIAGYYAGRLMLARGATLSALARLAAAGVVCLVVAMCWSAVLPFNKKLWTGSYVLLTVGLDLLLLPLLVYAIEVRGLRRGTYFFEVFGKNTLFIYLLSEVLVIVMVKTWVGGVTVYDWVFATAFAPSKAGSLAFAVVFMLVCWGVGWWLDRRRIYIKV